MEYFTKIGYNARVPVHLESVSPSGKYFVGWHTSSRQSIFLYSTLYTTDSEFYGKIIDKYTDTDDSESYFKGVEWFEEYGFVKIIFGIWCTMRSETVRLYFDRDLYESKKNSAT